MASVMSSRAGLSTAIHPRCSGIASSSRPVLLAQRAAPTRRVLVAAAPAPASAIESPPAAGEDAYAVIDVNGLPQYVTEGQWFACNSGALQTLPGGRLQFNKVIALRSAGEFLRGKPYLANVVVEAELVEEFSGPVADPATQQSGVKLGKVLVTKIRHTDETLKALEEVFRV